MSKLRIYIVEDEPLYANQLEMLVDALGYELVGICDNSDKAQKEIDETIPDLILMDVKINGSMNGIDLAFSLKHKPTIIFITSFKDDATFDRAKEIRPYAFITKPFDAQHLQRTIELAFNSLIPTKGEGNNVWNEDVFIQDSFFIKNRSRLEKVKIDDILYLEVEDRYCTIFIETGKKYVLRMSLGSVEERLSKDFFRVHRKYNVNLTKIKSIDVQDNLINLGEVTVPISRTNKEELLKRLDWIQ